MKFVSRVSFLFQMKMRKSYSRAGFPRENDCSALMFITFILTLRRELKYISKVLLSFDNIYFIASPLLEQKPLHTPIYKTITMLDGPLTGCVSARILQSFDIGLVSLLVINLSFKDTECIDKEIILIVLNISDLCNWQTIKTLCVFSISVMAVFSLPIHVSDCCIIFEWNFAHFTRSYLGNDYSLFR